MRVMVINEYQVNLGDESGRELVKKQMKAFLKIGEEQADTAKLDQNYRPQSDPVFRNSPGRKATVSSAKSPASLTCEIQKC